MTEAPKRIGNREQPQENSTERQRRGRIDNDTKRLGREPERLMYRDERTEE